MPLKRFALFAVTTGALVCFVLYQANEIRSLRHEISALSKKGIPPATAQSSGEAAAGDPIARQLDAAMRENAKLRAEAPTASESDIARRVVLLKDFFARLPDQQIPELAYLKDADWYVAVNGPLETPDDFRRAMAQARQFAESGFVKHLQRALATYLAANGGIFPKEIEQLQSYATEPMAGSVFQRYKIVSADQIKDQIKELPMPMKEEWFITQRRLVDSEYDSYIVIGTREVGSYTGRKKSPTNR